MNGLINHKGSRPAGHSPRCRSSFRADRQGTAAVEFALVAPLLFLCIVLPIFEFSRALMVSELVTNAARSGCRVGVLPGNSNSTITSAVSTCLNSQGIVGTATTIQVNGASSDVSNAIPGDTVTVTVTVPYSSNSWIPGQYLSNVNISSSQTMRRE